MYANTNQPPLTQNINAEKQEHFVNQIHLNIFEDLKQP